MAIRPAIIIEKAWKVYKELRQYDSDVVVDVVPDGINLSGDGVTVVLSRSDLVAIVRLCIQVDNEMARDVADWLAQESKVTP